MKLYAYRTLDYVQAAAADDRRYQLFCRAKGSRQHGGRQGDGPYL